jgi:acetoin utilization deacetylase AcuC-like enzyme
MQTIYTDRHRLHATHNTRRGEALFITEEVPERADIILRAVLAEALGPVDGPVDHGLDPILAVHAADYVDFLRNAYGALGKPVFPEYSAPRRIRYAPDSFVGRQGYYAYGSDTPILEGTWQAAYWSAQCALTAADHVRSTGETAYALCRPPGHHADVDLYSGFCYLNNAAIAARYLGEQAAILDVDFHHGNGTQEIFYSDPAVLYCSIHADPEQEFPYYWGGAGEQGEGSGLGFNRNWPLPLGADDTTYLGVLDEALVVIREFRPRYLVVSAGFDIIAGDPLGGFKVTTGGLREIGQRIAALRAPTLIVQEGGYLLERLGENAVAFLREFA